MALSRDTTSSVLERLGLAEEVDSDRGGLFAIYAAWCERVPFDNVQKRLHLEGEAQGPLPGSDVEAFFAEWLRHGTGGTCWAGSGALCELLTTLGFDAQRVTGTMLASPDAKGPNHGSVAVAVDGGLYLADTSMLTAEPVALVAGEETSVPGPAHGIRVVPESGSWHVHWRPLHFPDGFPCRIDFVGASAEEFVTHNEQTRAGSPFNFSVSARVVRGDTVIGTAFGQRVTLAADGTAVSEPISDEDRAAFLVDELGFSAEVVSRLPPG